MSPKSRWQSAQGHTCLRVFLSQVEVENINFLKQMLNILIWEGSNGML